MDIVVHAPRTLTPGAARVERRLQRLRVSPAIAIAIVGVWLLISADAQALTLIPLLNSMTAEYRLSSAQAIWALSIVGLLSVATVPILMRVADVVGMRRMILLGLSFAAVGNLLCAVRADATTLLIGRGVLGPAGVGVGLMFAVVRERSKTAEENSRGNGILTAANGLGAAGSFLLGGLIIREQGTVQQVFLVMTGVAVVGLIGAYLIIPDSLSRARPKIDWLGPLLLAGGPALVVFALTEGTHWGWSAASIIALLVAGFVLLVGFCIYELRCESPLIDIRAVANRVMLPSFVVLALAGGLAIFQNLAVVTYLQMPKAVAGYGYTASVLTSAYYLLPITAGVFLGSWLAHRLAKRSGTRLTMVLAGVLVTVNFLVLVAWRNSAAGILTANLLWGVGFAFSLVGAYSTFLQATRRGETGMLTGAAGVIASIMTSLSAAMFSAFLTSKFIPHTPIPDHMVFTRMWLFAAGVGVVLIIVAAVTKLVPFAGDALADGAVDLEVTLEATAPVTAQVPLRMSRRPCQWRVSRRPCPSTKR